MDYREALAYLDGLCRFGMRPGLDAIRWLAARAGEPQDALCFLHVAGTNGKGSTCAFLESIYRRAGWRVGLYTSPHLVSVRERMTVDGEPISESELAAWVADTVPLVAEASLAERPTFFEFLTLVALRWFRSRQCDLVVWETGMGGRLDATNLVVPAVSIITNVGWDHMAWLGNTLGEIAREKAGIIKPGIPVVTAADHPEALAVLRSVAQAQGAPLFEVREGDPDYRRAEAMPLSLAGRHQVLNAALACVAVRLLESRFAVSPAALAGGLTSARWPGRFDVRTRGAQTVVLDGAHNRPAFEALVAAMRARFPGQPYALVTGLLADKDVGSAVESLAPGACRVVVVPIRSTRAGDPLLQASRFADGTGGRVRVEQAGDFADALARVAEEPLVLVTGSLYLVGEAMQSISGASNSERGLNDWGRSG